MNYIIEDNINFFDLLKDENNKNSENICLISGNTLDNNYITLECSHKFNYVNLYNEIKQQKVIYNNNDNVKLKINQFKCPYCRKIINNLIPYIPTFENIEKINGVNKPNKFCMKCNDCEWIYKSGKQKNNTCKKSAFNTPFGFICETHWNLKKKNLDKQNFINNIWNDELEKLYNKYTVREIKNILKEKNIVLSGNKKDLIYRFYKNM